MESWLDKIMSSSEVLALLIPLAIIIIYKPSGSGIRFLIYYIIVAFLVNLAATLLYLFYHSLPTYLKNNNILYNIHSISRVIFFSLYIINVRTYRFSSFLKSLLAGYIVFCIYNFLFLESIIFLSSNLFPVESVVLLIMCLSYFFQSIQDDSEVNWLKHPSFLVCADVALYETITFFIFLFFYPLYQNDAAFSLVTMRIYAVTFVILCIFLSIALLKSRLRPARRKL